MTSMRKNRFAPGVGALACAAVLVACSSGAVSSGDAAGGTSGGGDVTLNLATVNNGQMKDMEKLKGEYEAAHPGTKVNFQVMEEGDLRSAVTADVAAGAGQYDVVTIGAYETPQWGANKWLLDLTPDLQGDSAYDVNDILPPVRDALTYDNKLYAVPFYGESSILMYNKDVLDKAGIKISNNPTWDEVAVAAKKVKTSKMAGICMRGKPGWGDLFAPLTVVVQTFGGNWYDKDWNATVDAPEWKTAVGFYKKLLDDSGEADPVSYSFNECLTALKEGKAAMWSDASVAASMLEADDSPVKGKMGYAHMPVAKTKESGWLWSWNLAIPATTKKKAAALDFVKWATSKDYIRLVGNKIGWSNVPPGSRSSTYAIPEYKKAAAAYAPITLEVMSAVNPKQPGSSPQPWVGIQYVAIPEFQDVGNQCAQLVANYLANRTSIDEALSKCQNIAKAAGNKHKGHGRWVQASSWTRQLLSPWRTRSASCRQPSHRARSSTLNRTSQTGPTPRVRSPGPTGPCSCLPSSSWSCSRRSRSWSPLASRWRSGIFSILTSVSSGLSATTRRRCRPVICGLRSSPRCSSPLSR
jgi:sorbitol/mannitol transport system substrate-binding protein